MRIYLKSLSEGAKTVDLKVGKITVGRGTLLDVSHVTLFSFFMIVALDLIVLLIIFVLCFSFVSAPIRKSLEIMPKLK